MGGTEAPSTTLSGTDAALAGSDIKVKLGYKCIANIVSQGGEDADVAVATELIRLNRGGFAG